ncbi:S-adenosyl-L-methionine-dependent methyltransferase [Xylaria acuta]|nr:S-adenosyl-L-methionine-dependent methyltransferase [Xylaria acuta]
MVHFIYSRSSNFKLLSIRLLKFCQLTTRQQPFKLSQHRTLSSPQVQSRSVTMNGPESEIKFVPKQVIPSTPQLYDELVGSCFGSLAKVSLTFIPPIADGAVIHDVGCGTGVGTAAVVEAISGKSLNVSIKGTDINEGALKVYREKAAKDNWPAEATKDDANASSFKDDTFTLSLANALIFVLPNDGIDTVKEIYRTLKPGGKVIINTWKYVPNFLPIQIASKATRPEGTPLPRAGSEKWSQPEFLQSIIEKGGFEKEKIVIETSPVFYHTAEMDHYANMLWSFIGGTTTAGWLRSDEENWDKAIEVVKQEVRKTEGYQEVPGNKGILKFVANIAIATK